MISELVTIENYFGRLEAVMTLEDMIGRYGQASVASALEENQIQLRCSFCRTYALLTDRARHSYDGSIPAV